MIQEHVRPVGSQESEFGFFNIRQRVFYSNPLNVLAHGFDDLHSVFLRHLEVQETQGDWLHPTSSGIVNALVEQSDAIVDRHLSINAVGNTVRDFHLLKVLFQDRNVNHLILCNDNFPAEINRIFVLLDFDIVRFLVYWIHDLSNLNLDFVVF